MCCFTPSQGLHCHTAVLSVASRAGHHGARDESSEVIVGLGASSPSVLTCSREIPYSPSFILDLSAEVDDRIRNVIDFVFLPGFNNPTVAVLYQQTQTWTGYVRSPL